MKELTIATKDGTFIFVTKNDEEFTLEEAQKYLQSRNAELTFPGEPIVPRGDAHFGDCDHEAWRIPDDKMRRHLFRKDLKLGIQFCVDKYGQSKEVIEAEARRLSVGGF
ncbi:hypothetical protein E4G67_00065 [Candidatus Bathyarchaeota archaeon]|nr:MAG: hypothetical protein E4G67_00065 [Candidatus Bathyarchaeota archaeon]